MECTCVDLKTKASLEVKRKEEKPKVEADDGDSEDGKIKGKYKGESTIQNLVADFFLNSWILCLLKANASDPIFRNFTVTKTSVD